MADIPANRPVLIGLTGSIGMGKTETAKMFGQLGIPVCDSDAIVHKLYAPCGKAVELIASHFPGAISDGAVDRAVLMGILQKTPGGFAKLESLVHPLVLDAQRDFARTHRAAEMIVFDIPLLFETGADARVDIVVVVSAPAEIQRARVLARPGMTEQKFADILSRQMPDDEKCLLADYVVDTAQGLEQARAEVFKIVEDLRERRKNA